MTSCFNFTLMILNVKETRPISHKIIEFRQQKYHYFCLDKILSLLDSISGLKHSIIGILDLCIEFKIIRM